MDESWIQIISLFLANAGLIIWFRAESRNDWRHMDNELKAGQRETRDLVREINNAVKEFHARLCTIEESRK